MTDVQSEHWLETYRSLIAISTEGFRFSALINGGAAVAILAYLGEVSSGSNTAPDMRCAVGAFLGGLLLCGTSLVFAYVTQLKLLNELREGKPPIIHHGLLLWLSVALFLASLVAFGVGSWSAVGAFTPGA